MIDNQNITNKISIMMSTPIDEMFRKFLVFQTDCGGIDAVAGGAERLPEEMFVP